MPLNPELVADILFVELNKVLKGNWDAEKNVAQQIETKAVGRATSPNSFTYWLIAQDFFQLYLRRDVDEFEFRIALTQQLLATDNTQLKEDLRTQPHRILFIESEHMGAHYVQKSVIRHAQQDFQIPRKNISFTRLPYPPELPEAFTDLLESHTGAILHNLSPNDLEIIRLVAENNRDFAQTAVVVKNSGAINKTLTERYQQLEALGIMMERKPFASREEVTRVILGIAKN